MTAAYADRDVEALAKIKFDLEKDTAASDALARLETRHATLEDVFVTLTGRHLRDG